MLLRGMLSDTESAILERSKLERYGSEDAVRIHKGYELGVIIKEYAGSFRDISDIVKKNNLNSIDGRKETSLRVSEEVNKTIEEIANNAGVSKIAAVRALLFIRNQSISSIMSKKYNIGTLNVDWFRNNTRSGKEWEYFEDDCNQSSYENIICFVKEFLEKENAVFFLQELPYKIKINGKWKTASFYEKFCNDFSSDKYEIYSNLSKESYQTRFTAAICKGTFIECKLKIDSSLCNNRVVSLCIDDITLLGVHMPTKFTKGDSYDSMWQSLICYTKAKKERIEKLIILGDFNAYVGCSEKLTEERYIELVRHAKDIVSDDTPTFIGGTPIDHVLITFDSKQKYKVLIEKAWEWSDHKFVLVGLELAHSNVQSD